MGDDRIEGHVGDESDTTAIGKNIKIDKTIGGQSTNNVYIYSTPDNPSHPREIQRQRKPARKPGKLMPDEAKELRESIDHLRVTMTRLEGTVDKNNALTIKSMDALQEQMAIFKAQVIARAPVWIAYLSVTLLAVIATVGTIVSIVWIYQVTR